MESYGNRGGGWQGGRRQSPSPLVLVGGAIVAILILVLAGIGLVSLLSGDDETVPDTTLEQITTTSAPTTTVPATTTTVAPATHVVQSGDSLFSIAEQYGVDLDALIAANPQITDPEDIDVGDIINLPPADSGPSATDTPDSGPADTATPDTGTADTGTGSSDTGAP